MTCLIIDTTQPTTWVALVEDGKVVSEEVWVSDRTLGVKLLTVIERMVNELGEKKLERIAVHGGPGHYSALRTGVVTVSMIAQEWGVELVQLHSTLAPQRLGTSASVLSDVSDYHEQLVAEALAANSVAVIVPVYKT